MNIAYTSLITLVAKESPACCRFVFHELSSTKVDNKVEFPLTGLDLADYISGPCEADNLLYDLTSCVCHFGGKFIL